MLWWQWSSPHHLAITSTVPESKHPSTVIIIAPAPYNNTKYILNLDHNKQISPTLSYSMALRWSLETTAHLSQLKRPKLQLISSTACLLLSLILLECYHWPGDNSDNWQSHGNHMSHFYLFICESTFSNKTIHFHHNHSKYCHHPCNNTTLSGGENTQYSVQASLFQDPHNINWPGLTHNFSTIKQTKKLFSSKLQQLAPSLTGLRGG